MDTKRASWATVRARAARAHTRAGTGLLSHPLPNTQFGIEIGNPVMMQKWAMQMATDRSCLPPDAHGVGIYSSHPKDNDGFTWRGNAALIAQDDAMRAAGK